jgi:hypothetical protein
MIRRWFAERLVQVVNAVIVVAFQIVGWFGRRPRT